MTPLTYTRLSTTWPGQVRYREDGIYDELSLVLEHPDGGTVGEMKIEFYRFPGNSRGIQLCCFGDGLPCLYDPRMQDFIAEWRATPEPDDLTVDEVVAILDRCGAVPSRYMKDALART